MAKKRVFSSFLFPALLVLVGFTNHSVAQDSGDQALTRAYQTAMQQLDNAGKSYLRSVERAWVAFKEKDFAVVASLDKMANVAGDDYESEENVSQAEALAALGKPIRRPSDDAFSEFAEAKTAAEADQALNSIYRQCLPLLDSEKSRRLKEIQALWIAFRDLYCRLDAGLRGGHSEDSVLRDLTMRRVYQLRHYGTLLSMMKFVAAGIPAQTDQVIKRPEVEDVPDGPGGPGSDPFRFAK